MRFEQTNEIRIRFYVIDTLDAWLFKKLFQKTGNATAQQEDGSRIRMLQKGQVNTLFGAELIRFRKKPQAAGKNRYLALFFQHGNVVKGRVIHS